MKRREQITRICKKIFVLPPLATLLIAIPSYIFVFGMLAMGSPRPISYLAYVLSAYAAVITVTGFPRIRRCIQTGIRESAFVRKVKANPIGNRMLDDVFFRSAYSLRGGLLANLLYAAVHVVTGIRNPSSWVITLAAYYILLSATRSVLVQYVQKKDLGTDLAAEYRRYRAVGIILLVMNQVLAAMVVYMTYKNKGSRYPGLAIYLMATYTFYITIAAIINVVKFRKKNSPVLSASKVISLTAAFVSMLSLETAMLAEFGGQDMEFRRMMIGTSGGVVCVLVLGMAIYMIVKATRYLRKGVDSHER